METMYLPFSYPPPPPYQPPNPNRNTVDNSNHRIDPQLVFRSETNDTSQRTPVSYNQNQTSISVPLAGPQKNLYTPPIPITYPMNSAPEFTGYNPPTYIFDNPCYEQSVCSKRERDPCYRRGSCYRTNKCHEKNPCHADHAETIHCCVML